MSFSDPPAGYGPSSYTAAVYGHAQPQLGLFAIPPGVISHGATASPAASGSMPPPYSQPGKDPLPAYYGHLSQPYHQQQPFRSGQALSPSMAFGHPVNGHHAVPGWMNTSPYPSAGLRTPHSVASGLTGGYTPMPARLPLNPAVNSFSPKSFTYPASAARDIEINPFFQATQRSASPDTAPLTSLAVANIKKANNQHRSASSISALRKQLGQGDLAPPVLLTPSRTPIASRGVSPAMSNNSAVEPGQILRDAYGLPINKQRIYKVNLPLEITDHSLDEQRQASIWTRQTTVVKADVLTYPVAIGEAMSRDVYPEDEHFGTDLPDTIDVSFRPCLPSYRAADSVVQIYLPNDWRGLRDVLFEAKITALGVTREYLHHVSLDA